MKIQERIDAFAELGEVLKNSLAGKEDKKVSGLSELINSQQLINPWFTPDNVTSALSAIARELTSENLLHWLAAYPHLRLESKPVTAGIIMAGNIPLAGFHDFLSVLISGNNLISKTSSKDSTLIVRIGDILTAIEPRFREKIIFTQEQLRNFDLVIATGSNNSSRYFDQYFGRYPNIIRKNRNSIAVIEGNETDAELEELGSDIFLYFGLGCRNVSKIFIPEGYDLKMLVNKWVRFSNLIKHSKYANNYDFSKAVYIVNKESFLDTGYLLLKEDKGLSSPVAVLYYEYYRTLSAINDEKEMVKDKIQCVVGHNHVPFGEAQFPHLWDYADGVDTLEFLSKKNKAGIL
ncbi:MAG: acyl-CoA reductase [Bacteroidales bacterium]|nr:acyl-CoA reductase [Bacteroidales bacterium]